MAGATAWKPAPASACSWCRQEYQDSGKPWHSSTSGPLPASATCSRIPFVSMKRWVISATAQAPSVVATLTAAAASIPRFHAGAGGGQPGAIGALAAPRAIIAAAQDPGTTGFATAARSNDSACHLANRDSPPLSEQPEQRRRTRSPPAAPPSSLVGANQAQSHAPCLRRAGGPGNRAQGRRVALTPRCPSRAP